MQVDFEDEEGEGLLLHPNSRGLYQWTILPQVGDKVLLAHPDFPNDRMKCGEWATVKQRWWQSVTHIQIEVEADFSPPEPKPDEP